jgi:hypothetical protein
MGKLDKEKRLDRTLKILTIVLSVFALLGSLQANIIAREANTPKVAVVDIEFWKGNNVKGNNGVYIYCDHRIRITNIGGVANSIIGYDVQLSFLDSRMQAEGTSTVIHAYQGFNQNHIELKSYLYTLLGVTGDPQMIFINPGEEQETTLPYKLEAGETVDIYGSTSLDFDPSSGIFTRQENGPFFTDPSALGTIMDSNKTMNIDAEFVPMYIVYDINLASGRHVKTPSTTCIYFEYIKD